MDTRTSALVVVFLVVSTEALPSSITLRNGVVMPLVAQGSGGSNNTSAEEQVKTAIKLGFKSIDTAHDYGDIAGVAKGIADSGIPRNDLFLTTKIPGCGIPLDHPLMPPCYENSLAFAKKDIAALTPENYVDLVLLHFPPVLGCSGDSCTRIQSQWAALEYMYKANLTRAIGVSNFCEECIKCVLKNSTVTPMVNQVQYHVGMGLDPAGLISYCNKTGIVVEAYSPLAHGRVLSNFPLGTELTAKYNWSSPAQVALGFIAQRGLPVVSKSANPSYLAEDLDLFGPSHIMASEDLQKIGALTQPSCLEEAPGGCCHA